MTNCQATQDYTSYASHRCASVLYGKRVHSKSPTFIILDLRRGEENPIKLYIDI